MILLRALGIAASEFINTLWPVEAQPSLIDFDEEAAAKYLTDPDCSLGRDERQCENCGDETLLLSSRNWCDGCEMADEVDNASGQAAIARLVILVEDIRNLLYYQHSLITGETAPRPAVPVMRERPGAAAGGPPDAPAPGHPSIWPRNTQ